MKRDKGLVAVIICGSQIAEAPGGIKTGLRMMYESQFMVSPLLHEVLLLY